LTEPSEELERELVIDVSRLDPEGEILEGEVDCVDLDEELVKPFGGVRYRLRAQAIGSELLVSGRLEQDFELVCSRCGRDFDTTIVVDDFAESYELDEKTSEIVLTSDVRDSIILQLPSYPVCDEACAGIEMESAMPADDRWNALDKIEEQRAERNQNHGKS